jgi:hypothetical protein
MAVVGIQIDDENSLLAIIAAQAVSHDFLMSCTSDLAYIVLEAKRLRLRTAEHLRATANYCRRGSSLPQGFAQRRDMSTPVGAHTCR